jgi:hypothetical protein
MIDPVAVLILSPWVIGPLLVWKFDLWREVAKPAPYGLTPVNRKLIEAQ